MFYAKRKLFSKSRRERDRISAEDRLLVYGAQVVCVNGRAFIADAYYGTPIKPKMLDIGLPNYDDLKPEECHLDHTFPWSRQGNDEIANWTALAESTNTYGFVLNGQRYPQRPIGATEGKGNRILMHSNYIGLICDEKVNVIEFAIQWREFLEEFDKTGKIGGRMWPFWLRSDKPPHRPIAPGWDGKKLDKRKAFLGDWTCRARFARIFLKHTTPEIAQKYKLLWRQKVGFEL